MGQIAALYRHPIKSLGVEALAAATLTAGAAMPFDRVWAVTHGATEFDPARPAWVPCGSFLRVTHCPRLAQVRARTTGAGVVLSHPDLPELCADPDTAEGAAAITAWAAALAEPMRQGPFAVARVPGQALTDAPEPWVSLASLTSLRALGGLCGADLDPRRFRANLWVAGWAPWAEHDLIGAEITVGAARLRVMEPIGRCAATQANPETGARDAPTLDALHARFGHRDFGVYATVVAGGTIAPGDPVAVGPGLSGPA